MARVVFIGPMGSGKTRLGRRVARRLGTAFIDTDRLIVDEHGPIADLFDHHGEPHFRALERIAVARALAEDAVVSLGGGAVLDAETRTLLAGSPVVLLTVSPDAVEARLADGRRPLVRGGLEDWIRIYEARRDTYETLADLRVDTSHRPMDHIADQVVAWLAEENHV
jgi:shikimate kinase